MSSDLYDNPWIFDNKPFTSDMIDNFYGFVYQITNTITNKVYIGRKYFYKSRKRKGKRRIFVESDWKDYYSSSKQLQQDVELYGKENFKREIISLHTTRGDTNYWETKELFSKNVLEEKTKTGEKKFYNDNIMNRYFTRKKDPPVRVLSKAYYMLK